ncbi:MAG: hypothetical protein ACRCZB_02890 [Bacteroidales bacterium]
MEQPYTKKEIEKFITDFKLEVSPEYVINYWGKKGWITKKGTMVSSMHVAIHVANSIYIESVRKKLRNNKCWGKTNIECEVININNRIEMINNEYNLSLPSVEINSIYLKQKI